MNESMAGIYAITHKPTGTHYIGQAINVGKRWCEHKKHLRAETHHNTGLQKLWSAGSKSDFDFWLLAAAPAGFSALQRQRWLVREERSYLQLFKNNGTVVNEADPEIVPTKAAVCEYREEVKVGERMHDENISARRREIKHKISCLEELVRPDESRLAQLVNEHRARAQLLKNCTGWRRLFHTSPSGFDAAAEMQEQANIEREYKQLAPQVQKKLNEIAELRKEYRRLYKQFSRVSRRRWVSTCWYAMGHVPTTPRITE